MFDFMDTDSLWNVVGDPRLWTPLWTGFVSKLGAALPTILSTMIGIGLFRFIRRIRGLGAGAYLIYWSGDNLVMPCVFQGPLSDFLPANRSVEKVIRAVNKRNRGHTDGLLIFERKEWVLVGEALRRKLQPSFAREYLSHASGMPVLFTKFCFVLRRAKNPIMATSELQLLVLPVSLLEEVKNPSSRWAERRVRIDPAMLEVVEAAASEYVQSLIPIKELPVTLGHISLPTVATGSQAALLH